MNWVNKIISTWAALVYNLPKRLAVVIDNLSTLERRSVCTVVQSW